MKTIGAKELRLHLDKILDRVLSGEDIIVRHRFKGPVRLSAVRGPGDSRTPGQKLTGLQAFDKAPKRPSPFDPQKPIKELYKESVAGKYDGK